MENAANHGNSPQSAVTNFPPPPPHADHQTAREWLAYISRMNARHLAALAKIHYACKEMVDDMRKAGVSPCYAPYVSLILDGSHDAITEISDDLKRRRVGQ